MGIEMGVDILKPIHICVKDMEPRKCEAVS